MKIKGYSTDTDSTIIEIDPNKPWFLEAPITVRNTEGDLTLLLKPGRYDVAYAPPEDDDDEAEVGWVSTGDNFNIYFDAEGNCTGWEGTMPEGYDDPNQFAADIEGSRAKPTH